VQVVGALLVLALLVTPAAAAFRVTASPVLAPLLSVVFAVVSAVGGILLALGSTVPISPFVTTISFAIYLACRVFGRLRARQGRGRSHRVGRELEPAGTSAEPSAGPSVGNVAEPALADRPWR
jgi:zinc/manganese transport system permease protein